MKILPRYLFNNLLMPLLYLLLAFTMLFIIADLMEHFDDFMEANAPFTVVLHYYALMLPSMVIFIVPICLLLATLYSLSSLTRHSEIIAMRASGVSIYRIIRPYLLMGVICFAFTAGVNEYFGPRYAYRADQVLKLQRKEAEDVYFENIPYENPLAGHSWYIESFDTRPPKYVMHGITLRQHRPDGSDAMKITAAKGQWLDHRWWFEDGAIQYYDESSSIDGLAQPFEIKEMKQLPEIPEDFLGEAIPPEFKSSLDLYRYVSDFNQFLSPTTLAKYRVDFHHKLTMPLYLHHRHDYRNSGGRSYGAKRRPRRHPVCHQYVFWILCTSVYFRIYGQTSVYQLLDRAVGRSFALRHSGNRLLFLDWTVERCRCRCRLLQHSPLVRRMDARDCLHHTRRLPDPPHAIASRCYCGRRTKPNSYVSG